MKPSAAACRWPPWLPPVVIYAAFVAYVIARDFGAPIYDDAYFFKRIALNALAGAGFAWNVGDGPVHASTSQLYQAVATALTALAPQHFVVATKLLAGGCLCGLAIVVLRSELVPTRSPGVSATLVMLGLANVLVLDTALTGMETALTLVVLATVLSGALAPKPDAAHPEIAAALATALVYLCRPDAAMIVAAAYAGRQLLLRKLPWRYAVALPLIMACVWLGFRTYYGTALPLSFHMKTAALPNYDAHVVALAYASKRQHIAVLFAFAAPLVAIAWRGRDPTTLALLGATALFWGYHALLTHEIMGYRARFYVPGMVPLTFAAARSWDRFVLAARPWRIGVFVAVWAAAIVWGYRVGTLPTASLAPHAGVPAPTYAAWVIAGASILLGGVWRRHNPRMRTIAGVLAWVAIGAAVWSWKPWKTPGRVDDTAIIRRHARSVRSFRGLFELRRCVPELTSVYHSEMGVPGLVLPRARLVDLVGIVSAQTVLERAPFDAYCLADRPEAIFLPHKHYRTLNRQIRKSQCLRGYRQMTRKSSSPLFVRADLADALIECAPRLRRWQ